MIKINQDDYLNVSNLFNNILENMSINDFKDVIDEFMIEVSNLKNDLKTCDLIFGDLDKLKTCSYSKNSYELRDSLSVEAYFKIRSFDYNKEIYYNTLTNSMTTTPNINETIRLAKFKISISYSNVFSAMQGKVILYCLDIISEDDLINEFYKSLKRKFMNSFKKNVSENFRAIDVISGKTVLDVVGIKSFVEDSIKSYDYKFNSIEIYNEAEYDNEDFFQKLNEFNLSEDDFYFVLESADKKNTILSDIIIKKSIMTYINNNLDTVDFDKVKKLFKEFIPIDKYINIGIGVIFNDDDFREIYKSFFNKNKVNPTFLCSESFNACKLFKYDSNSVYKEFNNRPELISSFFPNGYTSIPTSKYNFKSSFETINNIIKCCKDFGFKMSKILISSFDIKDFCKIILNINNNITEFNSLSENYSKIDEDLVFSESDFNEYIKPFLVNP